MNAGTPDTGLAAVLLGDWSTQLLLVLLSLAALASYALGARIAGRRPPASSNSLPGYLYVGGIVASFAWYAMPFFSQPRIPGWIDWLMGEPASVAGLLLTGFGLLLFVVFFAIGSRIGMRNLTVTGENFFASSKLLTDGHYGIVRHPMLMADVLAHLGAAMALGAVQTLVLFPIYYAINESFASIDEAILRRRHAAAYEDFRATTPRMIERRGAAILAVAALLFAWTLVQGGIVRAP